jgi:hypothetical protein
MMNTAGWICYAAIVDKIRFAYPETTNFDINYLSMIYMIASPLINPFATAYIETNGLRKALLMGVAIQVVGFWIRTMTN